MSVRLTNDKETRKEFKDRLDARIQETLNRTVPVLETKEQVFLVPVGYRNQDERQLFNTLTTTPQLKHTNDSARALLDILFNRVEKPSNVIIEEITLAVKEKTLIIERSETRLRPPVDRERDNRIQFKESLASKISNLKPVSKKAISIQSEIPSDLIIPDNFASMKPELLSRVIADRNKLTSEQANEVVYNLLNPVKTQTQVQTPQVELVEVQIPTNFYEMSPTYQKQYLTSTGRLSPEKADDLIANLKGLPVSGKFTFDLRIEEVKPVTVSLETVIEEVAPEVVTVVTVPDNYSEIGGNELYRVLTRNPNFACSNETALKAVEYLHEGVGSNIQLQTSDGSIILPFAKEVVEPEPEVEVQIKTKVIRVPAEFESFRPYDKFLFLQAELSLTPEQAQAILNDEVFENTKFEIWVGPKAPEPENPMGDYLARKLAAREAFNKKVQSSIITPSEKKEPSPKLEVEITTETVFVPAEFKSLKPFDQHIYLQARKNLTPDQAHALLHDEILNNVKYEIQYEPEIVAETNPMEDYIAQRQAAKEAFNERIAAGVLPGKRVPEVKKVIQPEPVIVHAVLPFAFESMKPRDQFLYLTTQLQWLPAQANELVAHLSGQETWTVFELEFKESD